VRLAVPLQLACPPATAGIPQDSRAVRRMAMFAAIGIIAAELLTGKDGIEQLAA
jgi:hypothetical protein